MDKSTAEDIRVTLAKDRVVLARSAASRAQVHADLAARRAAEAVRYARRAKWAAIVAVACFAINFVLVVTR